jgi:hypothetical protein
MFLVLREYSKVKHTEGWESLSEQTKEAVRLQSQVWGTNWNV